MNLKQAIELADLQDKKEYLSHQIREKFNQELSVFTDTILSDFSRFFCEWNFQTECSLMESTASYKMLAANLIAEKSIAKAHGDRFRFTLYINLGISGQYSYYIDVISNERKFSVQATSRKAELQSEIDNLTEKLNNPEPISFSIRMLELSENKRKSDYVSLYDALVSISKK